MSCLAALFDSVVRRGGSREAVGCGSGPLGGRRTRCLACPLFSFSALPDDLGGWKKSIPVNRRNGVHESSRSSKIDMAKEQIEVALYSMMLYELLDADSLLLLIVALRSTRDSTL